MIKVKITKETIVISLYSLSYSKFSLKNFIKLEKEHPNFKYIVGLSEPMPEDNWEGPTGFIHNVALDSYLNDHDDPSEIEYYMCGPPPMMNAVFGMLDDLGVEPEAIKFDDLIATGGTAEAAAKLIGIAKGKVAGFIFVINLFDLGGCEKLTKSGYKVENLVEFPGH